MDNSAAIEALERRLTDLERKGNALVEVINDLRAESGMPPRSPFGGGGHKATAAASASGVQIGNIQPDTFYGKKMQTAVREYLEMRKAAGQGPAKPRDIYETLKSGGFKSEAKTDHIALVGLRAMLRKRTNYFHKLPNGTYGLTAWYPDARRPKAGEADATSLDNDLDGSELDMSEAADDDAAVA